MKSFTKIALASMLAVAPVVAAVGTASANTELVPAARLVIPYWDVTSGRNTLFLLTNVSNGVELTGIDGQVHIEWYDKSCNRTDVPVDLSAADIDQIDLSKAGFNLPGTQGYADIDVRDIATRTGTSLQYNVLLGTVVISDAVADFAIAYPAASSLGSSNSGVGGPIVTRNVDSSGKAAGWSGSFEPFPSRVFVPMFFAEGGPVNTTSLLAIAAPANGNWAGGAVGEAPGQDVVGNDLLNPTKLISGNTQIWDACENYASKPISGHYILDNLTVLFGTPNNIMDQSTWNETFPTGDCHGQANFPATDFDTDVSGSAGYVGWIDIPNQQDIGPNSVNGTPQGDNGDETDRGMVGVLVQNSGDQGDVTRLWGDPSAGGRSNDHDGDGDGSYNLADDVDHCDIDPSVHDLATTLPFC